MSRTTMHTILRSFAAAGAATLLAACAEPPAGPETSAASMEMAVVSAKHRPDLGPCDSLAAPAGTRLVTAMFARGVQIYRWNGASWTFVAPDAVLYPNANSEAVVGTHYAGPAWESLSGSKTVGAVSKRCPSPEGAIPWLLLTATSEGPGVFGRVSYIQRTATTGGVAPAAPGAVVGEEARVPYTADYHFYR